MSFGSQFGEFDTMPRHSLAYALIGTTDRFVMHPSVIAGRNRMFSKAVRLLEYQGIDANQLALRHELINKNLILGTLVTDSEDGLQVFHIPRSARPLKYDTSVVDPGSFAYDDEQVFKDLGNLARELYNAQDRALVLAGDIGRLVTMVEFTKQSERVLYFCPGVEKAATSLARSVDPVIYYTERLHQEFPDRFEDNEPYFAQGFSAEA